MKPMKQNFSESFVISSRTSNLRISTPDIRVVERESFDFWSGLQRDSRVLADCGTIDPY
jgi:hypothetical protein